MSCPVAHRAPGGGLDNSIQVGGKLPDFLGEHRHGEKADHGHEPEHHEKDSDRGGEAPDAKPRRQPLDGWGAYVGNRRADHERQEYQTHEVDENGDRDKNGRRGTRRDLLDGLLPGYSRERLFLHVMSHG